jgi:hypothetical protein
MNTLTATRAALIGLAMLIKRGRTRSAWGKRSCRWSALAGVALRSPAREAVNTKERQQWKRLADSPTQCASLNLM